MMKKEPADSTTLSPLQPMCWGEKRYHSLDYALKSQFGEKVYRIALNGGMTCPNRDGKIGHGGCIFCSGMGSGDFAGSASKTITEQLQEGKESLSKKRPVHAYIAYFQAFTSTYAPVEYLRKIFTEAIEDPDVKVLAIATRPDCLGTDVLELLDELNRIKPVWIELGLQTIHPESARYIRRGYPLDVFDHAVRKLKKRKLTVIVHVILFLPGETPEMMLRTIDYLNHSEIDGVKLQLLHILKGTDLAIEYQKSISDPAYDGPVFHIPDAEEYTHLLTDCVQHLRPEIVIHRLTGDGPKDLLIAPLWTGAKRTVLNQIHKYMKDHDLWQGKEYYG